MSDQTSPTREQQFNAIRNEHDKTFWLGDADKGGREFPIKDLSYDDYVEFMELAQPIISSIIEALELTNDDGQPDVNFNPASLDIPKLIKMAGGNLPRMAWLCCKQSEPNITVADVKRIGRRPTAMIQVVIDQVVHNKLIQEFQDFFRQMGSQLKGMVPEAVKVAAPVSLTESTTSGTRS